MQTHSIVDPSSGVTFAFEVDNIYISAREAAQVLRGIPGVSNVRSRRPFSGASELRVAFDYLGKQCAVVEPFGDNSRFWIGPIDPAQTKFDVIVLRDAFTAYKPRGIKRILGDLWTLRYFRRR